MCNTTKTIKFLIPQDKMRWQLWKYIMESMSISKLMTQNAQVQCFYVISRFVALNVRKKKRGQELRGVTDKWQKYIF